MPADAEASTGWVGLGQGREDEAPRIEVVSTGADHIVVRVGVPGFRIEERTEGAELFQQLTLPGSGRTSAVGLPELPGVARFIALPQGATASVEIIEARTRTFADTLVYPAQEPPVDAPDAPEPPFTKNNDFYAQNLWFPEAVAEVEEPRSIRGCPVALLQIHPVRYNPARRTLEVATVLEVRISWSGGNGVFMDQARRTPHFEDLLRGTLLNYDALGPAQTTSRSIRANECELLIITDPAFEAQADELAQWKRRRGMATEVRTTAEAGASAEAIRAYIQGLYAAWPSLSFVLLMGDVEHIPVFYIHTHSSHGIMTGTDLYYGVMTGSGAEDYFPDLFVGRMPVDTAEEAAVVVNKVIGYERTPDVSSNWYDDVLLAAYEEYGRYFVYTSEAVHEHLTGLGYNTNRQYEGTSPPGTTAGILDAMNNGVLIANHRDHGQSLNNGYSTGGWVHPYFRTDNIDQLTNGTKLPFMFSLNCQSGWFDGETDGNPSYDYECFGEQLLRYPDGGVVGYVGSTRNSYSGYNDELCRGFYDAMFPGFDPGYPDAGSINPLQSPLYKIPQVMFFGKLWMYEKYYLPGGCSPYPWTPDATKTLMEFEMFNYLGDPSMEIWTSMPAPMVVTHAAALVLGSSSFQVNVDQDGALVAAVQGEEILATASSSGGVAVLTFAEPVQSLETIYITVTKHDYLPYEGEVTAIPPEGPYVIYASSTIDDSLGDGDGVIDAGETIRLGVTAWNVGIEGASGVTGTIQTTDPYITVSADTTSFGDIEAWGQAAGAEPYVFEVPADCPHGHAVTFPFETTAAEGSWTSPIGLLVHSYPDVYTLPLSVSATIQEGACATASFVVGNSGTSDLHYSTAPQQDWLGAAPAEGTLAPGGIETVELAIDATELSAGVHAGQVNLASDDPDEGIYTVPVVLTVEPAPVLWYLSHTIDDDALGTSSGDGDGYLEPGERAEMAMTIRNSGTLDATGVTATLAATDEYVTIDDGEEEFLTIPGHSSGVSLDDFDITVSPDCPEGHVIDFDLIFELHLEVLEGVAQTRSFSVEVKSMASVSGTVTDRAGLPIIGASVHYSGPASGTEPVGSGGAYRLSGLPAGSYTLYALAPGTLESDPVDLGLPPDRAGVDFALGAPDISIAPAEFHLSMVPGEVIERILTVENSGDLDLEYDIEIIGTGEGLLLNEVHTGDSDWVELYNASDSEIDMEGWTFFWTSTHGESDEHILPSFMLDPYSFVLLSEEDGPHSSTVIHLGRNIWWDHAHGGTAEMLGPGGRAVDFLRWGGSARPPSPGTSWREVRPLPTPQGETEGLARNRWSNDRDLWADWRIETALTPAAANPGAWGGGSAPWLSCSPAGGTLGPGESRSLIVTVDGGLLGKGIGEGKIIVLSNDPDESAVTVPVAVIPDFPIGEFLLELDASYVADRLSLNFFLGAPDPALWITFLVLPSPAERVIPLWAVPLSGIDPPVEIPITISFPGTGWVEIRTGLLTADGVRAADIARVDTGAGMEREQDLYHLNRTKCR